MIPNDFSPARDHQNLELWIPRQVSGERIKISKFKIKIEKRGIS